MAYITDALSRKFYVGSPKALERGLKRRTPKGPLVDSYWAKKTLAEAVEHARDVLSDTPGLEYTFVVRVVRVVRRRKTPLVVEKV